MRAKDDKKALSFSQELEAVEGLIRKKAFKQALADIRELKQRQKLFPFTQESATISYLLAEVLSNQGRYAEALPEAKNAYHFFKNTLENKRIAQILWVLGNIYLSTGKLKEAEDQIRDAITTYRRIDDTKGIIAGYNKIAQIYFIQSDFPKSEEYLKESIRLSEEIDFEKKIGGLLGNLATVNILQGKIEEAEKNLSKSILINEKQKDEIFLAHGYLSFGYIKFLKRDFARSFSFYQKAKKLIEKNNLTRDLAIYYEYSAELCLAKEDYQKAEDFCIQALKIIQINAPKGDIASQTYRILAELKTAKDELDSALDYCEMSLNISLSLNERMEQGAVYRVLGEIWSKKTQKEKARECFSKSIDLFQSLGVNYELAKTFLKAGRAGCFDHQSSLSFLEKSQKLFTETKIPYLSAEAKLSQACVFLEKKELDRAIEALDSAQTLFSQLSEEGKLEKIKSLREDIENVISQKSLSVDNEYRLFRRYLSEGEYKGLKGGSLEEILNILGKRVDAHRGFILLKNGENEENVVSCLNIKPESAYHIFSELSGAQINREQPIISTNALKLNGENVQSFLFIPLKSGEKVEGYLYLDRNAKLSPKLFFTQNQFNFAVAFADVIGLKLIELEKKRLEEDNLKLRQQLELTYSFPTVITQNPKMLKILWKLLQVKDSNLPVLLEGETGTGKDLIAKAVHYSGERKEKKLVAINCAALPESLFESELFGHKKGAYTGAAFDKRGLLEEADGGTLYLDEIADITPSSQIKLLRVLENKEFNRLGETTLRKVDIRVITSTNKDMEEEVEKGDFRKDLFYRLNAVHIKIPPLRQRREDIPLLVDHFLKSYSDNPSLFSNLVPLILELFTNYDWPGNVRELENEVRRVLTFNKGKGPIQLEGLSDKFSIPEELKKDKLSLYERMALLEKQYILKALMDNNWVKKAAARALSIPESSLRFKMKQYNLVPPKKK